MREYQVSYRGNRLVTKDNIIDVLNELGYHPSSSGGGLVLDRVTNWYLLAGKDDEVTMPNMDVIEETNWKTEYEAPYPGKEHVWRFTDYCYKDESNLEVPYLHIYTTPELITIYTSGGGMGVEFAYALFDKEVTEVILSENDGELPVSAAPNAVPQEDGEWTKSLDSLSYDADSYLWMSQRKISADGIPGTWEKPIRLSGADGDPGADAFDTEFIYKRMGRKPIQDDNNSLRADNERWNDDYVPRDLGWVDNPQGVDNDDPAHKYEWMAYRTRIDSTHDDYDPNHPTWLWSNWSDIKIWSAYGEKGMDGDGVQYVYNNKFIPTELNPTLDSPSSPVICYNYDQESNQYSRQTWYGDLILTGDPSESNNWRPKNWDEGIFYKWEGGIFNSQGEWIPTGWTDEPQGVGDFEEENTTINPNEPISETNPETITVTHPFEWVSVRKRVREVWGPFSEPTLWSTFSREHTVEIGDDGYWWIDGKPTGHKAEGEDGKGIDLKGRVDFLDSYHETRFMQENPDFSFEPGHVVTYLKDVDDETSDDFRDPEIGDCYVVTYNGHIYLYVGGDDEDWKKHWHDFGEFQGEGAYVHIAWAETITIEDGHVHSSGFVLDKELSDNIAGLDWMGIYTDNKINDSRDEDDYKWNYLRGRDGDNVERVYIRTAVEVTPEIEYTVQPNDVRDYPPYPADGVTKTYQSQEYLPFVANPVDDDTVNPPIVGCQPDGGTYVDSLEKFQFTDDPLGVTSTLPYEWMSERKKRDGEWKYFSTPSLHATYSHNGQSIIRSTIFRRWDRLDQAPQRPGPTFGSYEYPAGEIADPDWKDGIPTGTGAIWKSERVFTSDARPPQWDNWSIPTLVQDDDNYDVELSIQARNATPVPPVKYDEATTTNKCNSHHPAEGEEGYNLDLIADQQLWFDPVLDADYITENNKKFNWMATRTKYVNSSNLPEWRPWTIVLIKGEDGGTGPAGIGFQHAYIVITGNKVPNIKVNPEDSTEFISDVSGATGTWQLDTTNGLTVGPKQYLWMAERTVQSGVYGLWGDPVKISGEGTPGEDAEDIEFVYKQESRLPNNTSQNSDVPGYTTYTDINGKEQVYSNDDYIPEGWTDSPLGVSTEFKYEWMCQRIKPRTGDIEDPDNPWGPWSNVFVWSAYGDTGMDGDGVEYVFTVDSTLSSSTPASPRYKIGNSNTEYDWTGEVVNTAASGQTPIWKPKGEDLSLTYTWVGGGYNLQGEWIPTGWSDEPHGVGYFDENGTEVLYSYEWVSIRKRISGEWKEFSPPSLWSNFSKRQTLTIGDDGYWYDEDNNKLGRAEGEAGTGIELKDTLDVKFNRDKHSYALDNGISDETTVKSLQDIHPTSHTDTTSQYKDIQPGDCYVVKQTRHLYVCRHNKSNWDFTDNASTITDDTWDANKNWSDVGEFLGKGSYMHIAWAASKDPKREIQGDNIVFNEGTGTIKWIKYFVTDYLDKLPNVDYDWMGVYSDYDQLDPPSNFDLTANDGTTTDGKALNSSLYKWNNVRGRDGDNYERVYVKSKGEGSGYKPQLPSTYEGYDDPETGLPVTFQDPEYRPVVANYVEGENPPRFSHTRFTDDPTGVNEDYPYEWMCERRKKLNTTTHQVEWFPFSPPALWAKYSFDGNNGKSVQTRYVAVPKKTGLTIDQGYESALSPVSTVEGTPYTWQPNTSSYSSLSTGMYLWMTQRSTSDPDNDITTEWEIPIRLSGEDGKAGEDGADIEFVYLRNNDAASPPAPANPTAKNKSNNRTTPYYGDVEKVGNAWIPKTWDTANNDAWSNWEWYSSAGVWNNDGEWIPDGWSDNPQGVDSTYKYEWACQRTKSSGTNQNWTQWIGPFKWSAYGDTGMDGDGVEYVYFRWDDTDHPLATPPIPTALVETSAGEPYESVGWRGKVRLKSNYNPENDPDYVIQSDDWIPVNWPNSNGTWKGWDPNCGIYNSQGEWRPIVKVIENGDAVEPEDNTTFYWTDDPQGVGFFEEIGSDEPKLYIKEWVSVRKRIDGEWKDFSKPKVWASYGTDIYIDPTTGEWVVNGHPTGKKAEGKDGTGVALKDSVDFLSYKDKTDYVNDQEDLTQEEKDELMSELTSLQEIYPTSSNAYKDIQPGDCYVVKENRHLFVSLHDREHWVHAEYSAELSADWRYTQNWEDFGEFQGEGSYMHIAWASSDAIQFNSSGTEITRVHPFVCRFEDLQENVNYDWMGVYTDNIKEDYADNLDDSGNITDGSGYANWKYYKWNHVKGRDGSMHERVYIRTSKYDESHKPTIRNEYSPTGNYQNSEYYPFISNGLDCGAYNSGTTSSPIYRCTDDPVGVSAAYPYEWMSERHKTWDNSRQSMLWGTFSAPSLWATYSFDGMSVNLTRLGDSIDIDAAGNPVGGFSSSRLYTEVKAYDPKLNNGDGTFGGYLTYEHTTVANTLPTAAGKFTIDISSKSNCNATKTTAGRAYVSSITNTASNNCSFSLTIHVYGGRKFYFNFSVTIHHIPQTYLTYTLTNDSDTFTYRTRNGQYDGLPLSTTLDVLTTDGVVDKLNDNTTKSDGYISSVTVTGVGTDNFLKYAKETGYNDDILNEDFQEVVNNKTITVTPTDNGSLGTITHNTKTITIYKNPGPSTDTGLRLVVGSNGTVELKRAGLSSDVDLADTSHDLNISCTAVLGGVTYNSLTKTFGLSERNDATLYKLVLSCDSFIKDENGNYSPDTTTFSVKVNVTDGTGTTTVTPGEGGIIRGDVKVRYIDGPSLGIGNDSLNVFPTTINNSFFNSIQNKVFTVVVVEFNGETPIAYHDAETVDIVPPGVSQVWMDYTPDRFVVDCDANGIISSTTTDTVRTLNISAYLRWGNLVCTDFDTNNTKITLQNIGSGNYTTPTALNRNTTTGEVSIGYRFSSGKALTSGQAKIRIRGTFSNGITKDLTKYVTIEANRTGGPGPKGDFKSTAFIRTNTNIANWRPIGGDYDDPVPEGFDDSHDIPADSEGWNDGIPAGETKLWSSTAIFYGNGASHTWSYPEIMFDTETYDVEFALRQPDGSIPTPPNEHNRHKDGVASGYDYSATGGDKQIWFDPKDDATYISNNYNKFYWKAERELKSGIPQGSWVITQIKGEGAPEVRSDKTTVIIGTDPSGKIISSQTITLTTRLVVDNTIQELISGNCNIKYITFDSTITDTTSNNYELTITPSSINTTSNDCYINWSIPVPAGIVLRNSDLKITLGNAAYTAYRSVPVIFENRNQSQFTSYVFKRGSTAPTKPGNGIGSYSEPGPNDSGSTFEWNGWSDGLPSGSNNIYMSSRIFTNDGQPPQGTSWSTSTKLTLTDSTTKGLRFSLADAFPGKPGDTGKYWYNLGDSYSLPGGKTIENMIWMATGTRANSSSSWSWEVVRIKGETAETGRSIDSIWYKAFDTLDVTIPSITLTIEDLYAQGWNEGYIQPTRDNQYLWKFTRTAYINPDLIDHKGLDLVQVWSENMINPNLLDDTEFIDDNHINAWYLRKGNEWYSTGVQEKTDYLQAGTSHYYSGLPYKEYYVKHKLNDESDTSGTISFLAQYIYNTELDIRKITSNTWYTLSFLAYGQQTSNGVPVTKLTCDLSHITLASGTDIIWTERIGGGQLTTSTGESKVITFSSKNHWHTVTATFKTGDLPSSATGSSAERIEFKLSYLQTYEQYIWITRPKLEIGQVATEYIPGSGIRDPYPRMTVWGIGKQYYQGIWGEPYLDVVSYGGNWFRCRQTHISSNSNKPVIGQTTTYWEPANDFNFVATNLLLAETAVIDNLIATSLRTGERGVIPHVEMSGSRIEFYGTGMNPSIRFNVDASGTGILEFLDNDGNVLYNLGPNGITRLVDAMNSTYANSALYKITSSTYVGDLITMSGNAVNPSITGPSFNITDKYTLTEGYQKMGDITKYRISNDSSPSAFNGRMFDGTKPNDETLQQYLTNNNAEDYSTLFSDEVNWYITLNYGPMLSFSAINEDDAVYTMNFHQYSKGRLSKTITIYFTETEVRNAASNLRLLNGHRIVNDVVRSNLRVLNLLNL